MCVQSFETKQMKRKKKKRTTLEIKIIIELPLIPEQKKNPHTHQMLIAFKLNLGLTDYSVCNIIQTGQHF